MCKPYCVVYHCYLSSFPLNFLSIYKSLYIYICRFLLLNFGYRSFGICKGLYCIVTCLILCDIGQRFHWYFSSITTPRWDRHIGFW